MSNKEDLGWTPGMYGNGFLKKKDCMTHEEQMQSDLYNKEKDCGIEDFDGRRWNQTGSLMTREKGLKKVLDSQRLVRYSRYMSEGKLVVFEILQAAKG